MTDRPISRRKQEPAHITVLEQPQYFRPEGWPEDAPPLKVVALEYHWPNELRDHPFQWRDHPSDQKTFLGAAMKEVGFAGVILIYYPTPDSERFENGKPIKIDGHLRASMVNAPLPCAVLDVTDEESDKLIAEYDPIGWLAASNTKVLSNLLQSMKVKEADLQNYFKQLADAHGIALKINPDDVAKLDEFERFDAKKSGYCCPNCGHEWKGKPRPPLLPPDQRSVPLVAPGGVSGLVSNGDDDE